MISSPVVKYSITVERLGSTACNESRVAIDTCCNEAYSGSAADTSRSVRASSCSLRAIVSNSADDGIGRDSGCDRA